MMSVTVGLAGKPFRFPDSSRLAQMTLSMNGINYKSIRQTVTDQRRNGRTQPRFVVIDALSVANKHEKRCLLFQKSSEGIMYRRRLWSQQLRSCHSSRRCWH